VGGVRVLAKRVTNQPKQKQSKRQDRVKEVKKQVRKKKVKEKRNVKTSGCNLKKTW